MSVSNAHGVSAEHRTSRRSRAASVVAVVAAVGINLWSQISLLLAQPGWSFSKIRAYYPPDQLSYLAIVTNGANGDFSATEPFTQTGSNFYPRAYYHLLGLISQVTGAAPATVWNVTAIVFQAAAVAVLASVLVLLTRRWWTALLAPVPLTVGTFSVLAIDSWKTDLSSHAVLWGPFGVMYTSNGESASLAVAAIALALILLAASGRLSTRAAWTTAVLACALIGALASVQTYSFLTATYLLVYGAAAYGLSTARSKKVLWWIVSLVLVGAVYAVGPTLAESVSPLMALVFGAAPALPGLIVLCRASRWRPVWCAAALVLCALPQVASTALGVASGDEFLLYRESSSANLGIPVGIGLRSAIVALVILAVVFAVGLMVKNRVAIAFAVGGTVAWALVATNDIWGANQEPYRFWIDTFMLLTFIGLPVLAWVTDQWRRQSRQGEHAVRQAWVQGAVVVLVAVLVAVSTRDYWTFRADVSARAPLTFESERSLALAEAAGSAGAGLVMTDPCTDPYTLKAVWGGPTAFYNLGLAWPAERDALQSALDSRNALALDADAAWAAGVRWVVTADECVADWPTTAQDELTEVSSSDFTGGGYTLWELHEPA